MNVPRYADQAARLLSAALGSSTARPGDRRRGVSTIEGAILARRKRRGLRLWLLAAASFAAFASVGIWLSGPIASKAALVQGSAPVSVTVAARGKGAVLTPGDTVLRDGERLAVGSAIAVNREGEATLALSTGTHLDLEGDSNVLAQELDRRQRFYLSKGALEAKVAKLSEGQRFIVETPDAEVEVRGTQFRLEVLPTPDGCDVRTRLHVHEGVVEVRARDGVVRVGAGRRWPESCSNERRAEPSRTEAVSQQAAPPAPSAHSVTGGQAPRRAKPLEAPEPEPASSSALSSSVLVEQNDLFAEGVSARRRGDAAGAIAAYGRLIQKYPTSALVENATVERMRLLSKSDVGAAREEARRYLARYPSGFARAEAERIVSGLP